MSFKLIPGHADACDVEHWVKQFKDVHSIKTQKRIEYINIPSAFDIETTSFIDENGNKRATMYVWQFGINGSVIMGRTWRDFQHVLDVVSRYFKCGKQRRLIVYVHFLAYEFQWFRKWIQWDNVFSTDVRSPLYAVSSMGIEFRCSFMLSGYGLDEVGEHLTKYKVNKVKGFDYDKPRHSETPLTPDEYLYCEHDVLVVMAYIQEEMEREGNIARLPLTKTGYVRKYCRTACLFEGVHSHMKAVGAYKSYRELMKALTLDVKEFYQLRRAFQGGFTHANARFSGRVLEDVDSFDFTSSYPYVMCVNRYPMSAGKIVAVDGNSFRHYLKRYCCLFDVEFINLIPKFWEENYISASKCWESSNVLENNGRVVTADMIRTTITDVDFRIIESFYTWDSIKVSNFRIYERGYLPTDFIKAVISLYKDKTELKGVKGRESEYQIKKGMVNASYGMGVTNPVQELNVYNPDTNCWQVRNAKKWRFEELDLEEITEVPEIETLLRKYNDNGNRFLFYPWGIWITAYARYNLMQGVLAFGDDYVYSDTDSIKAINAQRHMDYIQAYNAHVMDMLERAAQYHGIPVSDFSPRTIKGISKPLGVWEHETSPDNGGSYIRFKTLGAKRYMLEKRVNPDKLTADDFPFVAKSAANAPDGVTYVSLTVSGLNKRYAIPYMLAKYGKRNIFDAFNNNLVIPPEFTGRRTTKFIDKPTKGVIIDYMEQAFEYEERSAIYMESGDYSFSLSDQYIDFLKGFREYVK